MATNEENTKKINDELEKMSDEELEQVAGGFYDRHKLAEDSRFLNVLLRGFNKQPERCNWIMVTPEKIISTWKSIGIVIEEGSVFGGHSYNLDGKKISQSQAWAYAEEFIGKHLERKDWDW